MSTKAIQGRLWSVAPTYWSEHFEPFFLPLYKKVLEQLKLTERDIVLDVGCGSGLFSSMVVSKGAMLTGVDAAPGLLEIARRRNPQSNFLEEDLESLPFADNTFDVVTGFNSFQYAGSFRAAIKEARRVLRPGGRLVIAIWDKPELSEATQVLKSITSLLPAPPADKPGPFYLSEDGRIDAECKAVGLKLRCRISVPCPFFYRELQDGINSFMGTGPAAAALCNNSVKAVEDVIEQALKQFRVGDNYYFLQNQFLYFIADK